MSRKNIRIAYHIFFWIAFIFVFPIWVSNGYSKYYVKNLLSLITGLPGFLTGLYFIVYYLVPQLLLKKKKYFLSIIVYLLLLIALTFHEILTSRFVFLPLFDPDYIPKYESYYFDLSHVFRVFVMMQSDIFIFISLKYLKNYIENHFEKEKLKTKMAETELNMLKSQIHPHFLFNTLNNIYTLSIEGDNKKVSDSIEKLSEILRYTIYECENKLISLDKEITIINNYIELEKLRYSNLKLEVSFPENVNYVYVIPLLFFTFVENAFKHGTSKSIKNKWLKIKLEIIKDEIHFTVRNSKSEVMQTDYLNYSKGIGLENAKKRLALCFGKENYSLEIKNGNNYFEIFLKHKILDNENKMLNC